MRLRPTFDSVHPRGEVIVEGQHFARPGVDSLLGVANVLVADFPELSTREVEESENDTLDEQLGPPGPHSHLAALRRHVLRQAPLGGEQKVDRLLVMALVLVDVVDLIMKKLLEEVAHHDYKKILATLATGRCTCCPFAEDSVETVKDFLRNIITKVDRKELSMRPEEGQCFLLQPIGRVLRMLGDPDWRIYAKNKESFMTGVRIGYKEKLPRTPAVYERKTSWHHYSEDLESGLPQSKSNYRSVKDNASKIEEQFQEELHAALVEEEDVVVSRQ